jgi:hypothetical protein
MANPSPKRRVVEGAFDHLFGRRIAVDDEFVGLDLDPGRG